MTDEYRKTLCDIDLIINELNEEEKNKIPMKLRKLIHENKLESYQSNINTSIPLEDQQLNSTAKAFLAMLYINYWCKDENEKKELISKLSENEKQYQKELSEKYSVDNLFKNRRQKNLIEEETVIEKKENTNELIPYKESIIKKILNKIFNFFKRR